MSTFEVVTDHDGRFHTLRTQADALDLQLEAVGAAVNQAPAVVEQNRWLQLIRNVGTGSPPDPSIDYSGGDVTDALLDANNDVSWPLADFYSGLAVDPDDTYGSAPLGPTRNGVLIQHNATGAFSLQLGGGGVPWWQAVAQGGLPFGLWWPLTILPHAASAIDGWVGCWYNDAALTPNNPYGAYLDTHLIHTIFGGYVDHVVCGFTDQKFFIECARKSGSNVFVLGGEFHPRIDQLLTQGVWPGYAQGGNLTELQSELDFTHRLARVAHATFGQVNTWEFWDGTGWTTNRAAAIELRDTDGHLIHGSAGFAEVQPGNWVLVAHQMVDTHLSVYHAPAPQGPWTRHARVLISPPVGVPLDGFGNRFQIAWHAKVHTHFTSPPAGRSIASLTNFPQLPGVAFTDSSIRLRAPTFVVVPWA